MIEIPVRVRISEADPRTRVDPAGKGGGEGGRKREIERLSKRANAKDREGERFSSLSRFFPSIFPAKTYARTVLQLINLRAMYEPVANRDSPVDNHWANKSNKSATAFIYNCLMIKTRRDYVFTFEKI